MRRRSRCFAALLALACSGAVHVASPRPADAGWWDDLDKGEPVRLADLIADPRRWKDKAVTFACVFHAPDNVFQPYFTSFHAERYLNFTAWVDGAPLWEQKSFVDDDFPYLYLRRDHPQVAELTRVAAYTRIEVTGVVKDVYRERPWIEIRGFRITATTLGKAVVDRVFSGDRYAGAGDVVNAEQHYRTALAEFTLDDTYKLRVRKRLADLLRAAGRSGEASAVEGGASIVGGTRSPTPPAGVLPGARPTVPTAPGAGVPAVTGEDALPGTDYGTRPAPAPAVDTPRPGVDFTPRATDPAARAGATPSAVTGEADLPGTPADAPPLPTIPSAAPPPPAARPPAPPAPEAPRPPPAAPTTTPRVDPTQPPPPPAPPTPAVPAPLPPADASASAAAPPGAPPPPAGPAASAPGTPPPPPPRTPRLSGVR